jgi:hypothetical protein
VDVQKSLSEFKVRQENFSYLENVLSNYSQLVQQMGPGYGRGSNLRLFSYSAIYPTLDVDLFTGAKRIRSQDSGHVEGEGFAVELCWFHRGSSIDCSKDAMVQYGVCAFLTSPSGFINGSKIWQKG